MPSRASLRLVLSELEQRPRRHMMPADKPVASTKNPRSNRYPDAEHLPGSTNPTAALPPPFSTRLIHWSRPDETGPMLATERFRCAALPSPALLLPAKFQRASARPRYSGRRQCERRPQAPVLHIARIAGSCNNARRADESRGCLSPGKRFVRLIDDKTVTERTVNHVALQRTRWNRRPLLTLV